MGLQVTMLEEMDNYLEWKSVNRRVNILDNVKFKINANRCIEPNHPIFPGNEISVHIFDINLMFSDYILENIVKIQMKLMAPLQGNPLVLNKRETRFNTNYFSLEDSNEDDTSNDEGEQDEEESEEDESDDSPPESSNQEFYTPQSHYTSEETLQDGGESDTEESGILNNKSNNDETTPEYSDIHMSSGYETELQEQSKVHTESGESEESEDENEYENSEYEENEYNESEESEDQKSDMSSDLDNHSDYSEDEVTKKMLVDNRKMHDPVDLRFILVFNRLSLKLSEIADDKGLKDGKYEGLIDTDADEIPHMDILEISIERLIVEFDTVTKDDKKNKVHDTFQNLKVELESIKIEDLQEEQNKDKKGNWIPDK